MKQKFLIPLLFAFFSGAALAQDAAPSFDELDTNADGTLSQDEVTGVSGLDFASADVDGDGSLSRDEYDSATGGTGGEDYETESP